MESEDLPGTHAPRTRPTDSWHIYLFFDCEALQFEALLNILGVNVRVSHFQLALYFLRSSVNLSVLLLLSRDWRKL